MGWGQKRVELDEDAKRVFEGVEGKPERSIHSRLTPRYPGYDGRDSLWAGLPLLCRPVRLPAQSTNAPTHPEVFSQGGYEVLPLP